MAQGGYKVRSGDNDNRIAHKLGISVSALHRANPGVRWSRLQIGSHVHVPGSSSSRSTSRHHSSRSESHSSVGEHRVRNGENDWLIAHHAGITVSALHRLNPDVRWADLQVGTKIRVPGASDSSSGSSEGRIRTRYAVVAHDQVNLRRGPGTQYDKVVAVDGGTRARVLDREHGWYKLRFPKGTVAWVEGDLLASSHEVSSHHRYYARRRYHGASGVAYTVPADATAIVRHAASLRGVSYEYGEASRSGTDCSGLTTQVYRSVGIHLPRTSAQQSRVGVHVSKGDLKPGDLVFFHTGRGHRVTHVGIYVGHGDFIHASSGAGRVQVNSLSDGYYSRRFSTARRVVSGKGAKKGSAKTKKG